MSSDESDINKPRFELDNNYQSVIVALYVENIMLIPYIIN